MFFVHCSAFGPPSFDVTPVPPAKKPLLGATYITIISLLFDLRITSNILTKAPGFSFVLFTPMFCHWGLYISFTALIPGLCNTYFSRPSFGEALEQNPLIGYKPLSGASHYSTPLPYATDALHPLLPDTPSRSPSDWGDCLVTVSKMNSPCSRIHYI